MSDYQRNKLRSVQDQRDDALAEAQEWKELHAAAHREWRRAMEERDEARAEYRAALRESCDEHRLTAIQESVWLICPADAVASRYRKAIEKHRKGKKEHHRVASSCEKCDENDERLWAALDGDR